VREAQNIQTSGLGNSRCSKTAYVGMIQRGEQFGFALKAGDAAAFEEIRCSYNQVMCTKATSVGAKAPTHMIRWFSQNYAAFEECRRPYHQVMCTKATSVGAKAPTHMIRWFSQNYAASGGSTASRIFLRRSQPASSQRGHHLFCIRKRKPPPRWHKPRPARAS
jgi:hypothetical protein